jgi:hypothetical protein
MIDLAQKPINLEAMSPKKGEVSYPTLRIETDKKMDIPDGEFTSEVHMKMQRMEVDKKTGRCTYTFDVTGIEPGETIEDDSAEQDEDAASSLMDSMQSARAKKIASYEE